MNFTKSGFLIMVGAVALLASTLAMAEADPAKFQEGKAKSIAHLQEKLQLVQKHLSCVEAATDQAAMKACHVAAKQEHDVLAGKMQAEMAERKAKNLAEPKK